VEEEYITGNNNCPVTEVKWVRSLSNRSVWAAYVTLLSRKSYALINDYNFWSSDKRSHTKHQLSHGRDQVSRITIKS